MKGEGCVSIECIYNDAMKKGLCIGVSGNTRSYHRDVIRLCWVNKKPELGKDCDVSHQAQMTPSESVGIGVALIRSSIVGETLLKNTKEGHNEEKNKKPA